MSVVRPSWAEQARTALAGAEAGSLVTRDRTAGRGLTVVAVEDRPDGCPVVRLEPGSPGVARLAACPVATLALPGPAPFRSLQLIGVLQPCHSERPGLRAYRLSMLSVRLVGAACLAVPLEEFHAAEPDPLRSLAAVALAHLERAHSDELLACVRAHGHEAAAVVPRALDRYGIELVALGSEGIDLLRLHFPHGPVRTLDQVDLGLRTPLSCRCDPGPD